MIGKIYFLKIGKPRHINLVDVFVSNTCVLDMCLSDTSDMDTLLTSSGMCHFIYLFSFIWDTMYLCWALLLCPFPLTWCLHVTLSHVGFMWGWGSVESREIEHTCVDCPWEGWSYRGHHDLSATSPPSMTSRTLCNLTLVDDLISTYCMICTAMPSATLPHSYWRLQQHLCTTLVAVPSATSPSLATSLASIAWLAWLCPWRPVTGGLAHGLPSASLSLTHHLACV